MPSHQFVWVNYPGDRTVFAGGNPLGQTNCLLTVNTGTHTFDLGEPLDYDPAEIRRKVANTSVSNPLRISFQPLAPIANGDTQTGDSSSALDNGD